MCVHSRNITAVVCTHHYVKSPVCTHLTNRSIRLRIESQEAVNGRANVDIHQTGKQCTSPSGVKSAAYAMAMSPFIAQDTMIICHGSRHGNGHAMAICTANFKIKTPRLWNFVWCIFVFYRLFMVMSSYYEKEKAQSRRRRQSKMLRAKSLFRSKL